MPKGSRGKRDYEKEIEEASKRMRKYPEYLRSARYSNTWQDFLIDIGVKEDIVTSEGGSKFWEDVRDKIIERDISYTPRFLAEQNVTPIITYRDVKGRFTKQVTGRQVITYRSLETGRFVSSKKFY